MTNLDQNHLLAIDGGGTSCRFALVRGDDRLVVRLGGANVYSAPEHSVQTLTTGLEALRNKAGLSEAAFHNIPLYAGLAGVVDDAHALRLEQMLPNHAIKIQDDRPCALAGALGELDGSLAGIGTGSFFACRKNGTIQFAGGYGFSIGDEGSAAWLGKRLLQRCLHVLDGQFPETPLVAGCLDQFQRRASRIVTFVQSAAPAAYGEFAPRVTAAAKEGDLTAQDIVNEAAHHIQRALHGMGHQPGDRLCLIGSVAPHYAAYLPSEIADSICAPQGEALDGAVFLARKFANELSGR